MQWIPKRHAAAAQDAAVQNGKKGVAGNDRKSGRRRMRLRRLEKEEHGTTRKLYETVFSEDSSSFVDYYYKEKTKENQMYVLEEDGGIRTMLHLNPYRMQVGPRQETLHYIVAVATEKAYRKRGYMGMVLKKAMEEMYQSGESFTFLMPASEKIYFPYGFRTVYQQCKKYVTEEEAKAGEPAEEKDCREMAERVNACLEERYQIYARRDEGYYRRLLQEYKSDGAALILYRKHGILEDYGILLPKTEPVPLKKPKIMIRIIHLLRFLETLYLRQDVDFALEIEDPWIEANCGSVYLSGKKGGLLQAKPGDKAGKDRVKIEELGAYLFGAMSLESWAGEAGFTQETIDGLQSIVPVSRIFLNETV